MINIFRAALVVVLVVVSSNVAECQMRTRTNDAELLDKFDADKNGWLNADERILARKYQEDQKQRRGRVVEQGPMVSPDDVTNYAGVDLFDQNTLRTLFIEFKDEDWEGELAAFYHTDVELPATLTVDGKKLSNVGVQFRGNSSFFSVAKGLKRSLSISFDHVKKKQNLEGYNGMTLLNSNSDPTFLRSVLYMSMARDYMPAPKVNFVRVVINGESWGVYVNQQRFNKNFLRDEFQTTKGIRIKSSNRSRQGGMGYLGEDPEEYRKWYEMKGKDKDTSWKPLINVCRVLAETPPESLKEKLEPIFNIDGALRFLALDIVVQSGDGYWFHSSDFNIYVDPNNVLHILHHDSNEAFNPQGGSRRRGGERQPGTATIAPFASMNDPNKALRQKLLVVPEFRKKYLEYVRQIAENSLDWEKVGPKVESFRALISDDVKSDTHKLYTTEQFDSALGMEEEPSVESLKGFFMHRRDFLLNHDEIKRLGDASK